MPLHIIKLCVGADTVDDLRGWRAEQDQAQPWILRTRMTPKRAVEVLEGGSVYRVFKGMVLCRQRILAIDTVGEGIAARCQMTLDEDIVLTQPLPRRPFQGWRYLKPGEAPADIGSSQSDVLEMPPKLRRQLAELGLL